jgi:hypothetical protein
MFFCFYQTDQAECMQNVARRKVIHPGLCDITGSVHPSLDVSQ